MIDMHMHTKNSDGDKTVEEILSLCEEKKLSHISITDHDNCYAYRDLEKIDIQDYYSGKIIPGVEMTTSFEKQIIEILGYGVDLKVINSYTHRHHSPKVKAKIRIKKFNKIMRLCKKVGIKTTKNLKFNYRVNMFPERLIYFDILKYKENIEILGEEGLKDFGAFYRKILGNPKSKLFLNSAELQLSIKKVIRIIKKAKGLCFLAHPYIYDFDDHIAFVDRLLKKVKLDGIECQYTKFTDDQTKEILAYTKSKGLYTSGGSDYHGEIKPEIKIGIGEGNLQISEKIIEPWIDKVSIY